VKANFYFSYYKCVSSAHEKGPETFNFCGSSAGQSSPAQQSHGQLHLKTKKNIKLVYGKSIWYQRNLCL